MYSYLTSLLSISRGVGGIVRLRDWPVHEERRGESRRVPRRLERRRDLGEILGSDYRGLLVTARRSIGET